jgi:hypothetical protein
LSARRAAGLVAMLVIAPAHASPSARAILSQLESTGRLVTLTAGTGAHYRLKTKVGHVSDGHTGTDSITEIPFLVEDIAGNRHICAIAVTNAGIDLLYCWGASLKSTERSQVTWTQLVASPVSDRDVPAPKADPGGGTQGRRHLQFDEKQLWGISQTSALHWRVSVPAGFTIIDAAPFDDWVFVATKSYQGFHDGELVMPMDTTQVWAFRRP